MVCYAARRPGKLKSYPFSAPIKGEATLNGTNAYSHLERHYGHAHMGDYLSDAGGSQIVKKGSTKENRQGIKRPAFVKRLGSSKKRVWIGPTRSIYWTPREPQERVGPQGTKLRPGGSTSRVRTPRVPWGEKATLAERKNLTSEPCKWFGT